LKCNFYSDLRYELYLNIDAFNFTRLCEYAYIQGVLFTSVNVPKLLKWRLGGHFVGGHLSEK